MAPLQQLERSTYVSSTRQRVMGVLFILIGSAIWFFFSRSIEAGVQTKFVMTPGGSTATIPDIILPAQTTLNVLAVLCVVLGVIQLIRPGGFGTLYQPGAGSGCGFFHNWLPDLGGSR